jgi:peptidoglycan-associated lipoprotein
MASAPKNPPNESHFLARLHAKPLPLWWGFSQLMNPNFCRFFSVVRLSGLLFLFGSLVLLGGCSKKKADQTAGSSGDYVTGTPLPERQEGTSFFSGNVARNQFQPIYFDFDSQTIRTRRTARSNKWRAAAKPRSNYHRRITDERGRRSNAALATPPNRSGKTIAWRDAQSIQTVSFGVRCRRLSLLKKPGKNHAQSWSRSPQISATFTRRADGT